MSPTSGPQQSKSLVLYDGVCHLCSAAVQFIIRHDPAARFQFAALQSETGQGLLQGHDLPDTLSTIVLIEKDQAYLRSTAALRIARHLRFPWPLLYYLFVWIPACLRDPFYNLVARHRYKWFGKEASCMLPNPAQADRFL